MPPDEGRSPPETRAGFCALSGRANVGKSTLLNRLVGAELAIVTPRPQTTRRRLLGIYSSEEGQAVFVDAPGLLEPRNPLQRAMRGEAEEALEGADVVVYVTDAGYEPSLEAAREFRPPHDMSAILCLNKTDRVSEGRRAELEREFGEGPWERVVATIATEGVGVDALREAVFGGLPPSPPLYPPDQLTTASRRFFVEEFVREACFGELAEEVPYSVAVRVEEFREDEEPLYISAVIYVERSSQKGIVIGEDGTMIRRIGTAARGRVQEFLDRRVYLDLWVKVLPKWRKKPDRLSRLGYGSPGPG